MKTQQPLGNKQKDVMENYIKEERYLRAKKKVDNLKGFYWHLFTYILVNIFISSGKVISNMNNGESFTQAFFELETFGLWFLWGIGLAFHAFGAFGKDLVLGKNWEEKKIREFIKKEEAEARKWE